MKVNAITKPIQQMAKPMSKPRKALLSAVAATALALTPMTTLNAQETGKEKVENVDSKKNKCIHDSLLCIIWCGDNSHAWLDNIQLEIFKKL